MTEYQTVYVVVADDHDYDAMSQWVVGVYLTMEDAIIAGKKDEESYREDLKSRGLEGVRCSHNYDITEVVIGK